ncbi:MAG TPA: trehalose-phosphatase, partial [Gaiellaceae bacterium]|nr:trehalose-phosphatase [Gaiellaceae bacterium]
MSRRIPADATLALLAEAPAETAILLDVDGVLAPIVARPDLAAVPEETKAELRRLVARYRLVACVSGREGTDARRLVGVDGVQVVGNHGLELVARPEEIEREMAAFRDTLTWPVEDKGLSLSLHYRGVPDEEAARAELERVAERARAAGLVPRWGRKVLEVRPPVEADKGTAVHALVERWGVRRALYAGDDTTDLDAFAALAAAGLEHVVRFERAEALLITAPAEAGVMVTNPPYGLRVGERDELVRLYPQLGDWL